VTTGAAPRAVGEAERMGETPVLLLHGQPGGARDWERVVAALGGHAEAIAIDRPGWDGHTRAQDLAGNARAALAALDGRGIDRAVVVGHSLGAAVAAWLAADHPERVAALVLAAPAANRASIEPLDRWLAAPVVGYPVGAASLAWLGLAMSVPRLRRRFAGKTGLDEDHLRASGRAVLTPRAWRAFVDEQRTMLRDLPALERALPHIAAPTTILAGASDHIVPAASSRKLAGQIPGSRLVVLERAGHLLPQLDAQRVADAIGLALAAAARL
jgi:pimeloyl-ACP methyl ester carboxylesterase